MGTREKFVFPPPFFISLTDCHAEAGGRRLSCPAFPEARFVVTSSSSSLDNLNTCPSRDVVTHARHPELEATVNLSGSCAKRGVRLRELLQ